MDFRRYTDGRCAFLDAPDMLGPQGLPDSLLTFDRYSEGLAVGRLVANDAKGLLSWGGFAGWFIDIPAPPPEVDTDLFTSSYQYKLYLSPPPEPRPRTYDRYGSHIGGQVLLVGLLDEVLPFRNATKLQLYYHVM